jgi:phosphoglycerate dehydrogenase-like enzyme
VHSAGLDVYDTELPDELPQSLIDHPKVIATGHYAWYSKRSHIELQKRAAHNLVQMLNNHNPEDCLNPQAVKKK